MQGDCAATHSHTMVLQSGCGPPGVFFFGGDRFETIAGRTAHGHRQEQFGGDSHDVPGHDALRASFKAPGPCQLLQERGSARAEDEGGSCLVGMLLAVSSLVSLLVP